MDNPCTHLAYYLVMSTPNSYEIVTKQVLLSASSPHCEPNEKALILEEALKDHHSWSFRDWSVCVNYDMGVWNISLETN